jgi:hypothetical protein
MEAFLFGLPVYQLDVSLYPHFGNRVSLADSLWSTSIAKFYDDMQGVQETAP